MAETGKRITSIKTRIKTKQLFTQVDFKQTVKE